MLLVVFAVIPAFALNAYTTIQQRRMASQNAQNDALNIVGLAAREQSRLIATSRQLLQSLSLLPEVKNPRTVVACNRNKSPLYSRYAE